MAANSKMMTILAARNGWSIRTRSGVYLATTLDQLLNQVKSYAVLIQKEAALEPQQEKQP